MVDGLALETATIRLLVVDDESLFRQALVRLLRDEPGFEVVGQADNGDEGCRQVAALEPDVVLMDLRMPGGDGIDAVRSLKRAHPGIAVLVLTSFESDAYIQEALSAGADGYLLKGSSPEALMASIRSISVGSRTLSSAVWDRLIRLVTSFGPESRTNYDGLTAREVQVVRLLAGGLANKQIAHRLNISEKTVRNHICNIYEKLEINDRVQAALYAARKGLVQV